MKHKRLKKLMIISLILVVISMTTVYAVTIIASKDVIYDNSKSGGSSTNVQGAIDELYELAESGGGINNLINENIVTYITNLSKIDTTNLAYDDTSDKNLRYIGSNPNNYVEFNGELWRIIGVMNNVEDADGNKASRVKIIRDESIGQYSWDNRGTYGSNDWSTSTLKNTLNGGPYWNKNKGTCYGGQNGTSVSCDFSSNGLRDESKKMITNIVWNIAGRDGSNATAKTFYQDERGTLVYPGRPTKWTGYVGLMYPSDYGYSVGGDVRSACLNEILGTTDSSFSKCYKNIWLYNNSYKWSMTQQTGTDYGVIQINGNGWVGSWYAQSVYYRAHYSYNVNPVVYLNTNLYISGGTGTDSDPYKITDKLSFDLSNAAPPKIDDEGKLKPVKLADDGTVTYVSQDDEEWYNYNEKKWANAVILVDTPSTTYKVGDTIKEDDIESYFVWIPKYKYKLWNTGTASKNIHEIEIIFDTKNTTDKEGESCKTPMTSGETGNCNNGEWMTHPAFISLGVDGFWVGKFETGYKGATSTAAAQAKSSDSSKIIIKPNVYSWRYNNLYNMFFSSYNYERILDSHLMKNTEWGAVAYLSHSKYGKGYEVIINNNSSSKTGYSSLPGTNQQTYPGESGNGEKYNQPYNTEIGYLASTTGNITGIYDMSGGAWEYISSYISGNPTSSGFNTTTLANYDAKYFDVYNALSSANSYQYRILGDGTGEVGPFKSYADGDNVSRFHSSWYGDYSVFAEPTGSWFSRGGSYDYGVVSGIFSFSRSTGGGDSLSGFRITLVG